MRSAPVPYSSVRGSLKAGRGFDCSENEQCIRRIAQRVVKASKYEQKAKILRGSYEGRDTLPARVTPCRCASGAAYCFSASRLSPGCRVGADSALAAA